jgi:hypothetical protein
MEDRRVSVSIDATDEDEEDIRPHPAQTPAPRKEKTYHFKAMQQMALLDELKYHPNLLPGEGMFQYFSPPAGTSTVGHLRLLVPDTIVVGRPPECIAWWYYTDAEGFVRATTKFTPESLVSRFGDPGFDSALVGVVKTAQFADAPIRSQLFQGNDLTLLTTRQVFTHKRLHIGYRSVGVDDSEDDVTCSSSVAS